MINQVCIITSDEKKQKPEFQEVLQLLSHHYKITYEIESYKTHLDALDSNTICLLYLSDACARVFIKNHILVNIIGR